MDIPCGEHGESLHVRLFELTQDLLDHLPVFQAEGQKDGFHQEDPFAACALFDIQPQSPYNRTAIKEIFRNRKIRK